MAKGSSEFNSADDRPQRLQEVLELFRSELDQGRTIDDRAFCDEHADLMPELGVQIRMLRRIRNVDADSDGAMPTTPTSDFDDDDIRRFLQENLVKYSIQDAISRGGQGLIFRAIQLSTHRDVAIKVLADGVFASRQQLERFMREIELAARLRHPNIVSIHDSGTVQNRPYCVMEFVDGEPVDDYVLLEQPGLRDRIVLFAKICRAVSYAHQRGVIHRDLKPANILVDGDGEPRLLDFGLAKDTFAMEASGAGLSMPGQVIGTLQYLSPEQIRGVHEEIDVRTDIYALGLVFYQVLTGALPYPPKESYDEVRENILETTPAPFRTLAPTHPGDLNPREIDADVEAILRKALEKEKDRRYQSADAMADDFERYLRNEIVVARADTRFYVLRKTIRRYRIQLAVASGFVVLATVAAIVSTSLFFRASTERDRANKAVRVAQGVTIDVLTDIDDAVSRLAGGQAVQLRIHERIQKRLEELAKILEGVGGVEYERALLHLNLGKIAVRKGDRSKASAEYRAAIETVSGADKPDSVKSTLRIEGLIGLGSVLDEPGRVLDEAIRLASARAASSDDDEICNVLLCEAEVQRARHAESTGEFAMAALAADRALAAFDKISGSSPFYERAVLAAVDAHDRGGGCRRWLGECEKSEWHYQAALALLDQVLEKHSADCVMRFHRKRIYHRVFGLAHAAGDMKVASENLELAISDAEFLCGADPGDFEWSLSLVHVYLSRARIDLHTDVESARSAVRDCEQRLAKMEESSPGDIRVLYLKALAMVVDCQLLEADGCLIESEQECRDAAEIFNSLGNVNTGQGDALDMLAFCYGNLGRLHRQLNWRESARHFSEACFEIRLQQYSFEPQSIDRFLGLIEARLEVMRQMFRSDDNDEMAGSESEFRDMDLLLSRLDDAGSSRCYRQRISDLREFIGRALDLTDKRLHPKAVE
ncbi:MAG: serine/threonine protein kinase [Phycisphaerales bacterium]|nr:serine/threonine protein kinase [Phycisphaerales bacterium]MCB9862772.1 serine/threonine protein kinase [Phycisphaerales bacterium]